MEDEALAQAVENVTAAEANVGAVEQTIADDKQKVKELSAEKKTAKTNHDAAKKYLNGLTADAEPATVEEAEGAVTGWESEHNRLTADLDAARNAVKSAQEFAKTAKAELREAKKAVTAAKKPGGGQPKVEREERDGIKRPGPGTISETLWSIFDAKEAELGHAPALGDVLDEATAQDIKEASVKAGYAHWRKFHGITGRVESQEQLAKRQAKEAEKQAKAEAEAA